MATTTPNFGWTVPTSTDLVKDGATAIETLGDSIDASFVDLKGGTTGQVLAKASGTDLDFSWVAQDDSNAIQNAIVDAKGDIIAATAADTPARLAVGANDTVLTADSTAATGLKWAAVSANSMTLLSTTTMSGVSTTISSISQAYEQLYIVISGVTYSTAASNFRMNLNGNTTNNLVMTTYANTNSSTVTGHANNPDYRLTNQSPQLNTSANNLFFVTIYNYASATGIKTMNGVSNYLNNSSYQTIQTTPGFYNATTAVTSITFEQSNGASATAGTIKIYGVK
jgi:hypothetical protein